MAQQDQLGPFSEYLTKPVAAAMAPIPIPQVTGLENTGAAIGNIAMNFINGLRQSRMQKYAMQEAEREKQFNAYQQAIKTVAASDLPDQQKQMLHAKLSLPLIQNIAGDKNATSKQTGNPLTDVVKNIATGLIGGNIPKKGQPLSMEPVVEALQMASDPALSRTRLQSQLDSQAGARISEILKTQPGADVKTFMSDPELRSVYSQAQSILGPSVKLPSIEKAYAEFRPMTEMEKLAVERAKEQQAAAREYTGAIPVQPIVPAEAPVQPEQTKSIPATTPTEGFTSLPMEKLEQDRTLAIRANMPTRESRGEPKMYIDQKTGETFQGFTTSGRSGFGIYRPDKQGLYSSGVRELTTSELTRPSPEQVEKVYRTSLDALNSSVSPKIFQSYKGLLDSMKEQGDIKGMDNAMSQAIAADRSEKEHASRMALAQQAAQDRGDQRSNNQLNWLDTAVQRNQTVKDWNTVSTYTSGAENAIKNATKDGNYSVADLLLLRAVAKLTDLQTGVRDKEYDTFADAKGRVSAIATEYQNLLSDKKDLLDAPTRQRFIQVLKGLKSDAASKHNTTIRRYKNIGRSRGISDDLLDLALPEEAAIAPGRDRSARPPGTSGIDAFKDLGARPKQ